MSTKGFNIGLLLTVVITLAFLYFAYYFLPHIQHWGFSIIIMALMVVLTFYSFFTAKKATKSSNLYTFTHKYFGITAMKILLCIVVVVVYKLMYPEIEKAFLYSFLIVYICFMVFETYVFTKLSKPV